MNTDADDPGPKRVHLSPQCRRHTLRDQEGWFWERGLRGQSAPGPPPRTSNLTHLQRSALARDENNEVSQQTSNGRGQLQPDRGHLRKAHGGRHAAWRKTCLSAPDGDAGEDAPSSTATQHCLVDTVIKILFLKKGDLKL